MLEFIELYRDGNVKDDIETEDRVMFRARKSTAICTYKCEEHTEGRNRIIAARRKSGVFIRKPDFKDITETINKNGEGE